MLVELDFTCRNGINHHIEGWFSSTWDALDWAVRVFGASGGAAKQKAAP